MKKPPKYCLHKPTGQACVVIPGPKRRHVYLGAHGSPESMAKYHAVVADWLAGKAAPEPPRATTLRGLAEAYIAHAEVYYRKRGEPTTHVGNVRASLKPLEADAAAASFDARALKAYRERLIDAGLTRGGCNRRVRIVVKAFRWAASEGLIPESAWRALAVVEPLAKDRSPARETEPVGPVSERVVEACLPHMPPPVAAMVRLQLLTGMRPGEACSMRRADIDAGRKTWIYRPESHKAEHHGRSRAIPLGPQAQALIRPFLPLDPDEPLFSPRAWMTSSRPNATRVYARQYTKDTYRQAVNRACDKAAVPRWHPNQLRHTYATRLRRLHGLEAAQVLLGHARADVTQIYAERDLKKAARIAAKVG